MEALIIEGTHAKLGGALYFRGAPLYSNGGAIIFGGAKFLKEAAIYSKDSTCLEDAPHLEMGASYFSPRFAYVEIFTILEEGVHLGPL